MQAKTLMFILWPSFLVAGAAEALFFTVFDPTELTFFGETVNVSRIAAYSIGFFLFWAFAASSSALTCFFSSGSAQTDRDPRPGDEGPASSPRPRA
jgi:hypothetical protein